MAPGGSPGPALARRHERKAECSRRRAESTSFPCAQDRLARALDRMPDPFARFLPSHERKFSGRWKDTWTAGEIERSGRSKAKAGGCARTPFAPARSGIVAAPEIGSRQRRRPDPKSHQPTRLVRASTTLACNSGSPAASELPPSQGLLPDQCVNFPPAPSTTGINAMMS